MSPRPKPVQNSDNESTLSPAQTESLTAEDIYRMKRDRNNVAVKKSREKSRQKNEETNVKMMILREENNELEKKIENLSQELVALKKELLMRVSSDKSKQSVGSLSATPTTRNVPTVPISTSTELSVTKNIIVINDSSYNIGSGKIFFPAVTS